MNEMGLLHRLEFVSSVSGGSIVAAQLASAIRAVFHAAEFNRPFTDEEFDEHIAAPLYDLTARDIRTGPILRRVIPWNWLRDDNAVRHLEKLYDEHFDGLAMSELPDRPRFTFCTTDLAFGVNWIFQKDRIGDYQAGYTHPPADFPVARAVAASSCFPPIFNPQHARVSPDRLTGGLYRQPNRDSVVGGIRLTDGGVYDNLGLEPVWKTADTLFVSDGGAPFPMESDRGLLRRLSRYTQVIDNQSRALRKRWLIAGFQSQELRGTYWGIGSATSSYTSLEDGYPKEFASRISRIRTDLDHFSDGELSVLENHGYDVANAAIERHVAPEEERARHADVSRSRFFSSRTPHPEYRWRSQLADVEGAIKSSSERQWLGHAPGRLEVPELRVAAMLATLAAGFVVTATWLVDYRASAFLAIVFVAALLGPTVVRLLPLTIVALFGPGSWIGHGSSRFGQAIKRLLDRIPEKEPEVAGPAMGAMVMLAFLAAGAPFVGQQQPPTATTITKAPLEVMIVPQDDTLRFFRTTRRVRPTDSVPIDLPAQSVAPTTVGRMKSKIEGFVPDTGCAPRQCEPIVVTVRSMPLGALAQRRNADAFSEEDFERRITWRWQLARVEEGITFSFYRHPYYQYGPLVAFSKQWDKVHVAALALLVLALAVFVGAVLTEVGSRIVKAVANAFTPRFAREKQPEKPAAKKRRRRNKRGARNRRKDRSSA